MSNHATQPVDESAYLGQQAKGAKRGMMRTIGDMGNKIEDMIDLKGRLERSPWLTLGVVVAAGVLAAELLPRPAAHLPRSEPPRPPGPNPILAAALAPLADTAALIVAEVAPAIVAALIPATSPAEKSEPPAADAAGSEG